MHFAGEAVELAYGGQRGLRGEESEQREEGLHFRFVFRVEWRCSRLGETLGDDEFSMSPGVFYTPSFPSKQLSRPSTFPLFREVIYFSIPIIWLISSPSCGLQ